MTAAASVAVSVSASVPVSPWVYAESSATDAAAPIFSENSSGSAQAARHMASRTATDSTGIRFMWIPPSHVLITRGCSRVNAHVWTLTHLRRTMQIQARQTCASYSYIIPISEHKSIHIINKSRKCKLVIAPRAPLIGHQMRSTWQETMGISSRQGPEPPFFV